MGTVRGALVSIDCADPAPLGRFWAALLGGEIVVEHEQVVIVRAPWISLVALRVDRYVPPTWPADDVPKQLHFELAVDDLDAAVEEAVGLGATLASHQPGPERWRVLLDPAGHPFCVTVMVPPELL